MIETSTQFQQLERVRPIAAIVFYHVGANHYDVTGAGGAGFFASSHTVSVVNGKPMLEVGVPVDVDQIHETLRQLDGRPQDGVEMIPDRLLAQASDCLVWYRPAAPARLWYAAQAFKDSQENERLEKVSGELFPQPALLFAARDHELYIFALPNDKRPTADTKLFRCPHWNIYDQGNLCVGSTKIPRQPRPSQIPEIEKGYFASRFTHLHGKPCVKGNFVDVWCDLHRRRAKTFPVDLLYPQMDLRSNVKKPGQITLGRFLNYLR